MRHVLLLLPLLTLGADGWQTPGPAVAVETVYAYRDRACVPEDGNRTPLLFYGAGMERVAALVYSEDHLLCRCEGDMEAAFRIVFDSFLRAADERERCRYGDAQVEKWRREEQEMHRKWGW